MDCKNEGQNDPRLSPSLYPSFFHLKRQRNQPFDFGGVPDLRILAAMFLGTWGWQPRWFVLDNGILSYYDSQDDVCKGSKGSIKMAVCEIKVHPTDNTRMELIIPGEQHFYMKAVNAAERQRWLVALGSSKACLTDTRTKKEKGACGYREADLLHLLRPQTLSIVFSLGWHEISETNESLKTKMSELRLYCDLLMQQVHTIQEFVHHDQTSSSPSIENMNEASSLLSATCNTFITTLEECVKIANAKFKPEMFQLPHPDPLVSPVSPSPIQMMKRSISHPGTYSSESHATKEPISSLHRLSQRRRRTYSDTESYNDNPLEDTERHAHCSRSALNGHLAPSTIPEENRSVSKKRSELEETLPSSSS
ncbi:pleckstrin homology domain-containing family A member 3 isoform X2 [Chelonia mydas]|uniref:pleckstrin homology domain-containing family A member 3 isoform X2 n=1 Tax=Chelonia mydas TaxID=8469 RepID=UPI0018A1C919|nr:pleckstrin homology domain-containing family A member 3 isoform X2 [Chelonia mydas]